MIEMETEKLEEIANALRDMIALAIVLRDGGALDGEDDVPERIDQAWIMLDAIYVALPSDPLDDEPPDYETQLAERDRQQYEAGKAEGELRRAERKIYGNELAEQFHAQDDLNRYNRGDDD